MPDPTNDAVRGLARLTGAHYRGPVSDHFDGERFFNPGEASTDRSLADMLRWKRTSRPPAWPRSVPIIAAKPVGRMDNLTVTAVGHATMLIQAAGCNILTDPVWSERASPVPFAGPQRVTEPGIAFSDLPPIDAVLVSHCHYDHLDLATLGRLVARHDPLIVVPLGVGAVVRGKLSNARLAEGDWHDVFSLGGDITTTLTPAIHWANRSPFDVRRSLWCGHYLRTPAGDVWFAGDTGYGDGRLFRAIASDLGRPDLALIPIGAYEPRWFMSAQHVDPAEAVNIHSDVGARRSLGIHWGTFQLTDEGRDVPVAALAAALSRSGLGEKTFVAAQPGEVYGRSHEAGDV
jgi:L-ascorbate metabolism protein UlaG (beta-lactamase superfamily)